MKISNINGNYEHKKFIKHEFPISKTVMIAWLVFQGYFYIEQPATINGTANKAPDVAARKILVSDLQENCFIRKPASDLLRCVKHLLSGVSLRIACRRSANNFFFEFE